MRLAVCALSAVLLSGCSWLGMGGHGSSSGAYGANCAPSGTGFYNGGGACGAGGGYGVAGNGYGAGQGFGGAGAGYGQAGYGAGAGYGQAGYGAGAGYGQSGYGAGAGYGQAGYGAGAGFGQAGYGAGAGYGTGAGYGAGGYGAGAGLGGVGAGLAANGVGAGYGVNGYNLQGFQGAYGAGGGVTTLGANAGYGSAVYGQNVVGTQYGNGQYVQGAGVQTVQGAPYYVPQPYPAYYGVPQLRGVGAALPFAIGAAIGSEFDIGGDLFGGKEESPNGKDFASSTGRVGTLDAVGYDDAFKKGVNLGGNLEYDVSRNTTLIGGLGFSKREGQVLDNGTFEPGTYDSAGNFTSSGAAETVTAEYSDLEEWKLEGGVRQYMGYNPIFRPYVGATGGFSYNNRVDVTQESSGGTLTAAANKQQFIDNGWRPTAAGVIGAEMAVGSRAALGVETGIRWRDNLDTNVKSEDRWSVPVSLRGRVAF